MSIALVSRLVWRGSESVSGDCTLKAFRHGNVTSLRPRRNVWNDVYVYVYVYVRVRVRVRVLYVYLPGEVQEPLGPTDGGDSCLAEPTTR